MQLSTMRSEVRFALGGISTTQYSDANINQKVNNYYQQATGLALLHAGGWVVNGEVATTNIVASQQEYVLPVSLLSLERVEVNFTGATDGWVQVHLLDMRNKEVALSNEVTSTHYPRIRVFDESLFLEDMPDDNVTGGLKIFYSEERTELSADADAPEMAEHLHYYMVYGACYDYALARSLEKEMTIFQGKLTEYEDKIVKHYSNRLKAKRPRLTIKQEHYE